MLGYERWHAAGRGFVDVKTAVAAVFAALGIGVAAWSVLGTGGGEAEAAKAERSVISTLDSDGLAAEAEYRKTKGSSAAAVVGELAAAAMEAAKSVGGFGTQGGGASAALGDSIELALGGLISGDHEAFLSAMAALGGTVAGEIDGEHPLFARLAAKLKGAEVDVTRLEVKAYVGRRERAELLGEEIRARLAKGEQTEGLRQKISERVMEVRPSGLFEDAGSRIDGGALDVRFPFLARGAKDEEWLGMVLVWNGDVGKWQPATFQLIQRSVSTQP